jgi:DNA-binding LacI/PurR family transcriptional regulator
VNRLTIAVEASRSCAELGLNVADDIAVVGCDDKMFVGLLSPALTTLRVPKYDIGARFARMLLDRISCCGGESEVLLRPEFIVRQSAPRTRDPYRTNTGGEDT